MIEQKHFRALNVGELNETRAEVFLKRLWETEPVVREAIIRRIIAERLDEPWLREIRLLFDTGDIKKAIEEYRTKLEPKDEHRKGA
jgi:hypothetical protein